MNKLAQTEYHSVDEEWLASYCAGGLSSAKRLLIACQVALNSKLSLRLDAMDAVGGALLESAAGEAVSDRFFAQVIDKLDSISISESSNVESSKGPEMGGFPSWAPSPLEDFLAHVGVSLKWKKLGFGMERASLPSDGDGGENLYLLKSPPGLKIPRHSHDGEEWALILQGGYHVGDVGYKAGDLHREDENCTHTPIVDDDGEQCITLVAIEGGLRFSNPIMRLLKPVLGI